MQTLSWSMIALVGAGGAAGALARYGVMLLFARYGAAFPFGTLAVNVAGSFIIAVVATLANKTGWISHKTWLLAVTGFCGGFTTFSSLVFEASALAEHNGAAQAATYLGASVAGGFAAFYAGVWATSKFL